MKSGYLEYVQEELLRNIPDITSRRLFSGYGLYQLGAIFGIIINDVLYFKVGDMNKQDYIHAGSKPFTYVHKRGKIVEMPYWEVPIEVMEDQMVLMEWIEKAIERKKKVNIYESTYI